MKGIVIQKADKENTVVVAILVPPPVFLKNIFFG